MFRGVLNRLRLLLAGKELLLDPSAHLFDLDGFRPNGFVQGIEILNDSTTPLDFVVHTLVRHAGLSKRQAMHVALRIHTRGGVLHPLPSERIAAEIVDAVTAEARTNAFPLVCRVVTATMPHDVPASPPKG